MRPHAWSCDLMMPITVIMGWSNRCVLEHVSARFFGYLYLRGGGMSFYSFKLLVFAGNDLFFLRHRYHRYRLHFDMGHLITYFFHKRRIGIFSILCKIYKSVKSMLRQARFYGLKLIQDALKVIVKYILKLGYRCLDVIHLIDLELHFRNFRWWHHQHSYSQVSFNGSDWVFGLGVQIGPQTLMLTLATYILCIGLLFVYRPSGGGKTTFIVSEVSGVHHWGFVVKVSE
jgi:hypothetical protein